MTWDSAYTVHGRLDGEEVEVTWEPGALGGTPGAVDRVRAVLADEDLVKLTPQDRERPTDVEDPAAVMAAIQQVLEITSVDGDPPIPEPDPSAG